MTEFRAGLSLKVKKRGKTIVVIEEWSGLTMSCNGTITREGAHPV